MAYSAERISVQIAYPTVIAMEIRGAIEVDSSSTLSQIQDRVFESFSELFRRAVSPTAVEQYGRREHVTLKDQDVVIDTDALLQQRLQNTHRFQAVFQK